MKTTTTPHIYQLEPQDFTNNSIAIPHQLNHSFLDNSLSLIIPASVSFTASYAISNFIETPSYIAIHPPIQGIKGKPGNPSPQAPATILNSIASLHTKITPYNDYNHPRQVTISQSREISANLTQEDTSIIKLNTNFHNSWNSINPDIIQKAFFPSIQNTVISFNFISQIQPLSFQTVVTDNNTYNHIHSVITDIQSDTEEETETEEKTTETDRLNEKGYYVKQIDDTTHEWYVSVLIPSTVIAIMKEYSNHSYQWKVRYVTRKTGSIYNWRGWSKSIPVEINTPPAAPVDLAVVKRTI